MSIAKKNAPGTRDMERINWIEFREWVPAKIQTVLLPLGTLEPHGVAPNGTDILAPVAMAREIAPRVNAMVAPAVPYGFTGILDAYPGSFTIPEDAFRGYVRAVLAGLAKNKFKNIILLNGHGGGQTAVLSALAQEVGRDTGTRILVVNWWSYCSDVTLDVFGEDGGHGGKMRPHTSWPSIPLSFRESVTILKWRLRFRRPIRGARIPFHRPSGSTTKARVIRNLIR